MKNQTSHPASVRHSHWEVLASLMALPAVAYPLLFGILYFGFVRFPTYLSKSLLFYACLNCRMFQLLTIIILQSYMHMLSLYTYIANRTIYHFIRNILSLTPLPVNWFNNAICGVNRFFPVMCAVFGWKISIYLCSISVLKRKNGTNNSAVLCCFDYYF